MSGEHDVRTNFPQDPEELSLNFWMQVNFGLVNNKYIRLTATRDVRK